MKKLLSALILVSALLPGSLVGQELPRPSMIHNDQPRTIPTDYNMRLGPVLFNFNSSVEADYNDNISLSHSGAISDFILTPEVGIGVRWPVTETNTLSLSTSLGYQKYLIHPQYDTSNLLVSPDSRLAFDIYTGNFKINVHDQFSYQQDPTTEGVLSNVVNFNRFENIAGVSVLWDLNKLVLNLNYDHINFISTGIQTSNGSNVANPSALDYSADQVSASADVHMSSTLSGGIEGAGSIRRYDHYSGDYTAFSVGPFMRVQITEHIKAELSGGYQHVDSPSNMLSPNQLFAANIGQTGSGGVSSNGYYVSLTLDHEVNKFILERLALGHDIEMGVFGEQSDTSYVNYTASWHVNSRLNLALNLGYQDVSEQGGLLGLSSYNMLNAGVQASFPVTKSLSGSLFYQLTDKLANQSNQEYLQNRVGLIITYHY